MTCHQNPHMLIIYVTCPLHGSLPNNHIHVIDDTFYNNGLIYDSRPNINNTFNIYKCLQNDTRHIIHEKYAHRFYRMTIICEIYHNDICLQNDS